jgi:hypothetical protein
MPKWNGIKCNKCGYIGKPKDNAPKFGIWEMLIGWKAMAHTIKYLIYFFKFYPPYSCPKCKNPKDNKHNIEYILTDDRNCKWCGNKAFGINWHGHNVCNDCSKAYREERAKVLNKK